MSENKLPNIVSNTSGKAKPVLTETTPAGKDLTETLGKDIVLTESLSVNKKLSRINIGRCEPVPQSDQFMKGYYVSQRASGEVLDLGCNNAWISSLLHPTCKYTGLEINEDLVKMCKPNTNVKCYDMTSIPWPFGNSTFDTVLWLEGPEMFIDPIEIYSEIYRVIKPSGTLILAVSKFLRFVSPAFPKMYEYDLAEIIQEIQENRFAVANWQEVSASTLRLYRKLFLLDCKPIGKPIVETKSVPSSEVEILKM